MTRQFPISIPSSHSRVGLILVFTQRHFKFSGVKLRGVKKKIFFLYNARYTRLIMRFIKST